MTRPIILFSDDYQAQVVQNLAEVRDVTIAGLFDFRARHEIDLTPLVDKVYTVFDVIRWFGPDGAGDAKHPMTAGQWQALSRYEHAFLAQTDRLSYAPVDVTVRRRLFQKFCRIWFAIFADTRANALVYFSSPHLGFDFAGYAVAETTGVQVRILNRTGIGAFTRVVSALDLWNAPEAFDLSLGRHTIGQDKIGIEDFFAQRSKDINKTIISANYRSVNIVRRYAGKILNPFVLFPALGRRIRDTFRTPAIKPSYFWISGPEAALGYRRATRIYKNRISRPLEEVYRSLTGPVPPDGSYVFYAAHFQPERSTAPEAGVFDDQLVAIQALRAWLPGDVPLVYKEHPRQFDRFDLRKRSARSREYFETIAALPNTYLVSFDIDSATLIEGSKAVATSTGTAGWEGLRAGRPVIIFGDAWYRNCGACLHVSGLETEDPSLFLSRATDDVHVEVERFLEYARRTFVGAAVREMYFDLDPSHDRGEHARVLAAAIADSFGADK